MRLIGLHGRLQSGKDSVFSAMEQICEEVTMRNGYIARRAFADNLKMSGLAALGLPSELSLAEVIKQSGLITVDFGDGRYHEITGRQFWQFYGTEAHRDEDLGYSFGTDFWVDNLLPKDGWTHSFCSKDISNVPALAVVTDVRFPNEATRIKELGGEVWRINADTRLGSNKDQHASEQALPIKYLDDEIDNNGSLNDLRAQVASRLFPMYFNADGTRTSLPTYRDKLNALEKN